jgi:hypothetical protein
MLDVLYNSRKLGQTFKTRSQLPATFKYTQTLKKAGTEFETRFRHLRLSFKLGAGYMNTKSEYFYQFPIFSFIKIKKI